jgi:Tfp pilus assembly protein PilO
MKELLNKLLGSAHFFIIIWVAYGAYEMYEAHEEQMNQTIAQFPTVEADIEKQKQKLKEIQDFIKKAEEYKVRVEEVAKNIEAVQRQLPAETSDSQILAFFQEEMKVLNIKNPDLRPGMEQPTTYFISKDYNLKASGTFLQFLVFLERIGTAARIYTIQSLRMVVNNSNNKGRFQVIDTDMLIQAYRYNPAFKVERGFTEPEKSP